MNTIFLAGWWNNYLKYLISDGFQKASEELFIIISPLHRRHGFGRAVEVLFELQLKGLADGTDDTLG